MYYVFFLSMTALIVQWLGHLVVAEKTWVRFPLGAHNTSYDVIVRRLFHHRQNLAFVAIGFFAREHVTVSYFYGQLLTTSCNVFLTRIGNRGFLRHRRSFIPPIALPGLFPLIRFYQVEV